MKDKRMKILLVSEYYPPKIFGGGELSAQTLASSLADQGIEVHVLTSQTGGVNEEKMEKKVKVHRYLKTGDNPWSLKENIKRLLFFPCSLRKAVRELDEQEQFDVIHCLNTTSIFPFKKKKIIATINSYTPFCPKGNLFYKEQEVCDGAAFFKCSGCIAQSQYVGKSRVGLWLRWNPAFWIFLYRAYKRRLSRLQQLDQVIIISEFMRRFVDNKRVSLIYTIMEEKTIQKEKEEFYRLPIGQKMKIGYIGTLDKIKGVDILIKAAKTLKDAQLYIIGDGPERELLEKEAGNAMNISFLGRIDPGYMSSVYKQVDVIVIPSLWPEPFSRVGLEAIYHGKPIIASASGGNKDVVIDGKTGFLCNSDPRSIAEKLGVLKDRKKREQMGKAARELYTKKFEKKMLLKKIIEQYKKQ